MALTDSNSTDSLDQTLVVVKGGTDNTSIGNASDSLKTNLRDSSGTETGTAGNPFVVAASLSLAPDLLNGRLFSASALLNAATADTDNPLILLRNPVGSTKTIYISKVLVGIAVTNVLAVFKVFGQPTLTNTTTSITNITQNALSTTVTVTTSSANGATVGATVTISGTTDFNGTYAVASVTSSTVFTFTRTAVLITTTNTSGTCVVSSSLGTTLTANPMKRVASPTAAVGLATSLPTLPSNGDGLITVAQGQNTTYTTLVDSDQISLEPGQHIVVTGNPASNNRNVSVTILWSEVTI